MVVSFIKMHKFFYQFKAFLSATVYCICSSATVASASQPPQYSLAGWFCSVDSDAPPLYTLYLICTYLSVLTYVDPVVLQDSLTWDYECFLYCMNSSHSYCYNALWIQNTPNKLTQVLEANDAELRQNSWKNPRNKFAVISYFCFFVLFILWWYHLIGLTLLYNPAKI